MAPPDVAAELAQDIAAPQYGIGLQLFDTVPDAESPARTEAGDDEAEKKA